MESSKYDIVLSVEPQPFPSYDPYPGTIAPQTSDEQPMPVAPRYRRALKDILPVAFLISAPMLVLSLALIGLVFYTRLIQPPVKWPGLSIGSNDESGVLYLNMGAPRFVFIASLSSSAATALSGLSVSLSAYPVARYLMKASNTGNVLSLPTTLQMSQVVALLDGGGLKVAWNWIRYTFSRRALSQPGVNRFAFLMALSSLAVSGLISAADTWLHITTKSVQYTRTTPWSFLANTQISSDFGSKCWDNNNTWWGQFDEPCVIQSNYKPEEGYLAIYNSWVPSIEVLANTTGADLWVYNHIADRDYAYLGPSNLDIDYADLDFAATSFAASTQCELITDQCIATPSVYLSDVSHGIPFHCNETLPGFAADLETGPWIEFFTDGSGTNNQTWDTSSNPFYFGLAGTVLQQSRSLVNYTGTVTTPDELGFVAACKVTIYDLNWSWVNGSIRDFEVQPSNDSMSNLFMSVMAYTPKLSTKKLFFDIELAAAEAKTTDRFAQGIGQAYSNAALAVGSGVMERSTTHYGQSRYSWLVTRVQIAPLAVLVFFNLVYAALGIFLAIVALVAARGGVWDVRMRLTGAAIVAQHHDGGTPKGPVRKSEHLFREMRREEGGGGGSINRVGVERNGAGGWELAAWSSGVGYI